MSVLERAARALFDAAPFRDTEGPYEAQSERYRRLCRHYVRAVLMAVREMPSETQAAIFDARDGFVHEIDIPAVWEAGIDTILADGGE